MINDFCFCTLAVGLRYRRHAKMLATDLQQYAPTTQLVILTDQPEYFHDCENVLAFAHRLKSVKGYHDKRFVLSQSLALFETCIFLDSDVRIIGDVPQNLEFSPGITARAGCALAKRLQANKDLKELAIIQNAAKKLEIDLDTVWWLHEFMFVMKKQDGIESNFFDFWQTVSYYFENNGFYHGECYSIGLAAAKVGLNFDYMKGDIFPFFKDNIEKTRIQKGQSTFAEKQIYFEAHTMIESPNIPIWKKTLSKTWAKIILNYRILRLKIQIRNDIGFRKLFR